MSKKNLVEIICVIDRSGSMEAIKSDAIGGFNTFLDAQKKLPSEAKMTVVLFNHGYKFIQKGTDIRDVPPFDQKTYVPEGTTALLDAVGRTIDDTGKRLADTPEGERPEKVIFAILTDGLENASKDYAREKIHGMIKHQRENYAWEFIFLAANQDAFAEAEKLCIDRNMAYNFAADSDGIKDAMEVMCCSVAEFRAAPEKVRTSGVRQGKTNKKR
jgi:hypothetical protein